QCQRCTQLCRRQHRGACALYGLPPAIHNGRGNARSGQGAPNDATYQRRWRFSHGCYCTTISTRRLRVRPASSALLATGASDATPFAVRRAASILWDVVKALVTALARASESAVLASSVPTLSVCPTT